jgi:hypothetical protein
LENGQVKEVWQFSKDQPKEDEFWLKAELAMQESMTAKTM